VVVLDQPVLPGVPLVGIDDAGGAGAAFRHLVGLGHRPLAVLAMPLCPDGRLGRADATRQRAVSCQVIRQRLAGAAAAAAEAGITWAQVPIMECATNDPDAGALGAAQLLARPERPTAIFAFSDQLALGTLRAAHGAGISAPDRLSVVGFDDSPPAHSADPPLTTVAQPLRERGHAVGAPVRALVRGEEVASPAPYPVQLVVRGSSAAVPTAAP